uniref:DNA polymerase III subunit delta n=2 Tax=Gloeothece TaxID=28070 RepID=E0UMC8_GLOV7|nr:DNA polymerase III, delta subunit [Gloeothece verrucosa PCC 7822]
MTGDNDFLISQEIQALLAQYLAPEWSLFNYNEYPPDSLNEAIITMNQPPIGNGFRVVHLIQCPWFGTINDDSIAQVEKEIDLLPSTTVLILTASKIDRRLKVVKMLIDKAALFKEFNLISPWDEGTLITQLYQMATSIGVDLTQAAAKQLIIAVGNDTRLLSGELEKLKTFVGDEAVTVESVNQLVDNRAATSIDLAKACLKQDVKTAIATLENLNNSGEAAPKILASLITLFRQWTWTKALVSEGVTDTHHLEACTGIYKGRCYYLMLEVETISLERFIFCQEVLLKAQIAFNSGNKNLKLYIIQLCQQYFPV